MRKLISKHKAEKILTVGIFNLALKEGDITVFRYKGQQRFFVEEIQKLQNENSFKLRRN